MAAAPGSEAVEISNAVQDYAKAIWSIAQRGEGAVSTSAIADVDTGASLRWAIDQIAFA